MIDISLLIAYEEMKRREAQREYSPIQLELQIPQFPEDSRIFDDVSYEHVIIINLSGDDD